ncbi:MAG TPA: hypothetical protein VM553_20160 [Dongiaceae bacterium]|nr:hypothetical protein [Dongiaceae bacterium]
MSDTGHHTLTLKENRLTILSLSLVLLAFLLTAWIAWLNYSMHRSATTQILKSQQLQERAQAHVQDQYTEYMKQEAANRRFEKAFEIKQRHYADFMGAVADVWLAVSRTDNAALENALHQLQKSNFGLEPFLDTGSRHYLQKRMKQYDALSRQLLNAEYRYKTNQEGDKKTLNQMSDEFQTFLYPLLFEPDASQETPSGDQG